MNYISFMSHLLFFLLQIINFWESSPLLSGDIDITRKIITHTDTSPYKSVINMNVYQTLTFIFLQGLASLLFAYFYVRLWKLDVSLLWASFILYLKWPPLCLPWWVLRNCYKNWGTWSDCSSKMMINFSDINMNLWISKGNSQ